MNKVRITAMRQTVYKDLMEKYENPIQHACDVRVGQQWVFNPTLSDVPVDEQCPEGLCPSAWHSMKEFAVALAKGEGKAKDTCFPDCAEYIHYDKHNNVWCF